MTAAVATPEATETESLDAQFLADALLGARRGGWTRPELAELTGLTVAQVWRVEQGRVHADEVDAVDAALVKIVNGEVQPKSAAKPRDERQARIDAALALIDEVGQVGDKITKMRLAEALGQVRQLLAGTSPEPGDA